MFLWLKTLYRKRAVTWPFIFYTIIWTLSESFEVNEEVKISPDESYQIEYSIVPEESGDSIS